MCGPNGLGGGVIVGEAFDFCELSLSLPSDAIFIPSVYTGLIP